MASFGRGRGRGRGSSMLPGSSSSPLSTHSPPGGISEKFDELNVTEQRTKNEAVSYEQATQSRIVAVRPSMTVQAKPLPDRLSSAVRLVSSDSGISSTPSPSSTTFSDRSAYVSRRPVARETLPQPSRLIPVPPRNMPRRPDFGQEGRPIKLVTNHFEINAPDSITFHHYDVSIIQEEDKGARIARIEWSSGRVPKRTRDEVCDLSYQVYFAWARSYNESWFHSMVYDRQRHLYSSVYLGHERTDTVKVQNAVFSLKININAETPQINVSKPDLKLVAFEKSCERDRSPMQVLDILHNQMLYFKRCIGQTKYMPYGRNFYLTEQKTSMPLGRELREGFVKSLKLVNGSNRDLDNPQFTMTMNIDYKVSPFFIAQPLIDTVKAMLNLKAGENRVLKSKEIEFLRHHLRDVRVRTTHTGRVFTIVSIGENPATKEQFETERGAVDVASYFKGNYGSNFEYTELPCVRDQNRNWFPIEVLHVVPNQKVDLKKLTPEQSSLIIRHAAVTPEERRQKILEKSNDLSGSNGNDEFLKRLGLERQSQMMKVNGRVLAAPCIAYGSNGVTSVSRGSWNIGGNKLAFPATIQNYVVVCFDSKVTGDVINRFITALANKAKALGMRMPEKCVYGGYKTNVDELLNVVDEFKRKNNIDLAICIMKDGASPKDRNHIKFTEKTTDVVTQCLALKTLVKFSKSANNDALLENILLKINCKCGGINNEVVTGRDAVASKWFTDNVMFVGLDVNHPPPLSKREIATGVIPKKPSLVGAVANCGARMHDYLMDSRAQDSRCESISDAVMTPIIRKFLSNFQKNKNRLPDHIIVYRDGVSESQFSMVMNQETLCIKNTCTQFSSDYSPKVTVLTVQKRHNTRFFKEERSSGRNAEQNVPAGTVVDSGPVGPFMFDFFLASQSGIQGTTKAANYVVMHDENGFKSDELHRLTFLLCHVYQRASKSVSLPAPCYYAHHAATRGKELADGYLNTSDESSSGFSSQSESSRPDVQRVLLDFDKINQNIAYGAKLGQQAVFL